MISISISSVERNMVASTFGGRTTLPIIPVSGLIVGDQLLPWKCFIYSPPSSDGLQLPLCLDPDPLFQKLHTYCYGAVCLQVLPAFMFVCLCAYLLFCLLGAIALSHSPFAGNCNRRIFFAVFLKINVFNCFLRLLVVNINYFLN